MGIDHTVPVHDHRHSQLSTLSSFPLSALEMVPLLIRGRSLCSSILSVVFSHPRHHLAVGATSALEFFHPCPRPGSQKTHLTDVSQTETHLSFSVSPVQSWLLFSNSRGSAVDSQRLRLLLHCPEPWEDLPSAISDHFVPILLWHSSLQGPLWPHSAASLPCMMRHIPPTPGCPCVHSSSEILQDTFLWCSVWPATWHVIQVVFATP